MPDTLAALVRKKYPGAYDDLSDEQLEAKVDAKYPGAYSDMPRSQAEKDVMATPAPGHTRPFTREDLTANQGLYAPLHPGDILGGLAMAVPEASEMAASAVAGAVRKVAPAVTGVARIVGNPLVLGGIGAYEGYKHGGLPGAIGGAALAVGTGKIPGWLGLIQRGAKAAAPAAEMAAKATPEAIAATEAAVRGARTVSPTLSNVTFTAGTAAKAPYEVAIEAAKKAVAAKGATAAAEAAPSLAGKVIEISMRGDARKMWAITDAAGKPVQTFLSAGEAMQASHAAKRAATLATQAAEAAPTVAKVAEAAPTVAQAAPAASGAVAAAARHKAVMEFAKDAAARNPKIGEKIWFTVDKAGNPLKILTPDQAGAAKRAGIPTSWAKNLW